MRLGRSGCEIRAPDTHTHTAAAAADGAEMYTGRR